MIRRAQMGDVRPALDLALKVFMQFEAEVYGPEAIDNFKRDIVYHKAFIENWQAGRNAMFVALEGEKIIGVIGEKYSNGHINLLFVDGDYHRRGIATMLMDSMVCELKLRGFNKITLFSSPYGLPFYLHYGFIATDSEQRSDGFIFTPMSYMPGEIWDIYDKNKKPTGRYIQRGRPGWREGDYHLVVHAWKHNNGQWLIDRRALRECDNLGGLWETTGGSAIAGDSSLDAALRETKEELGIELVRENGRLFCSYIFDRAFIDVWVFDWDGPIQEITLQEGETCDVMWADSQKIIQMIESNEFLGHEIYPYINQLFESHDGAAQV